MQSSALAVPRDASCPERGFTLIEMVVVVGLLGLLAAMAAPSYRSLILEQQVRAGTSALQESLWFARSEALKRKRVVSFTIESMEKGWNVVLEDAASTVLLHQPAFPGLRTTVDGGSGRFQYNPYGRLESGGAGLRISLTDNGGNHGRCIRFDHAARPQVSSGACL